jgi:aminotransferase
MLSWTDPASYIHGLTAQQRRVLKQLEVQTVGDLVSVIPRRYDDYSNLVSIANLPAGEPVTVKVKIKQLKKLPTFRKRLVIIRGLLEDETGAVAVTWFNQPWMLEQLKPGDEIILLDPAYQGYFEPAAYFGSKMVRVPMKKDKKGIFRPNVDAIAKACTPKTKAIMICSPDNPTGAVYTEKELKALADVCVDKNILCISDEIYTEFVWGRKKFIPTMSIKGMEDRTFALMSFSKTFAWTGNRAGYIIASPELSVIVNRVPIGIIGMPVPFQYAGAVALEKGWGFVRKMKKEYKKRLDFSVKRLNEIKGIKCPYPEGTFYVFPDISEVGLPCAKFHQELLLQEKVRGAAGTQYGQAAEGHIRFALVDSMERLDDAWNRVDRFVKKNGKK